ncbi:alpha/beta hydrolase [Frankia sp. CcI49]|uniref:Pimeloyl-ACP methyl ester carboxylesterase n=1 Tax=Parafrankia irregularis TaxID=795642 RepID=A0A0S4QV28_9ACTN|nr:MULTISPECIES: alpha/beta hydrolase [Frankiaceae]KPM53767.1 alpha/beta hydrolase [Frankia sp. R43]MBE3203765.1 alpha/beta hydrolase [Parafrankia sp. CH37]ONH60529.1 alpha/beta hydrolase [Frankia sp. CcI49]CUU58991.1 Pimeloyl-ACP methyl ester carboxylesterase [Parafrankia irregularis]
MYDEAPAWFEAAIDTRPDRLETEVDGTAISYRCWGPVDGPAIVLVHGGAAHAGWWDHIAPLIPAEYRVLALDLSGHGDSGRREEYSLSTWASEVIAVIDHAGITSPPIVIGHSMGGWVTITTAAEYPDRVAGIVVIDSPVKESTPEERAARERTAFGPLRVYATAADALARFRTVPEQPNSLSYIIDHIARNSMGAMLGGWAWKFDPNVFGNRTPSPEILRKVHCRVVLFRAEKGLVTPDIGHLMYNLLGRVAPVIEIPLAGHHVMLDQPLSLVTGIRTILADWEHSSPQERAD